MKAYVEARKISRPNAGESIASDIMRHLYTRQYLGKAVIVCEQPIALLSAARKQWLKLARSLQRQRSSTLNADKILKYTHGIAHMQRLTFSAKTPLEQPNADIFFLAPHELGVLPAQNFTVYLTAHIGAPTARSLTAELPTDALIVDYLQKTNWEPLGFEPKKQLEVRVAESWQQVLHFLNEQGVNLSMLHKSELHSIEAMDDALDTLLGISHHFLVIAGDFQRTLEIARPMRIHKTLREKYDSFILLAHRVQALTPGAFSQQFLQIYNEDDTYFLYDHIHEQLLYAGETPADSHARHSRAGRKHLARALHHFFISGAPSTLPGRPAHLR